VPDEPAHYNYVRHLAETGRFPLLQMGDYPHDYLEEIKAARFPDAMSIDPIRYEAHQPPLYYLLAAVIYNAASSLPLDQQVVVLRLFSVALGGLLLCVAYRLVKEIFPQRNVLALATAAFVATVPMHIAMTAAINNDALAELILSLLLLLAVKRLKDTIPTRRYVLLGGLLFGLALLTKTTIYPAIFVLAVAEMGRIALQSVRPAVPRIFLRSFGSLISLFSLSSLVSFWWFARNALTYGDLDLFGWGRHEAIVVGQPRTAEWVARFGARYVANAFARTTFKSFWAQFGWMGVLVDERIYQVLFLLCALAGLGLILFVAKTVARPGSLSPHQRWSLALLALSALLTFGSYGWYNLTFVQHQGRYLFPAIVPLGLFFALGVRELIAEEHEGLLFALLFLGLLALDLICLFRFIVPYFQ
jgi:4-amino-4-deoxy-L-arabinose transferase-like glycosyltransferase